VAAGSLVLDNTIKDNTAWGLIMTGGAYVGNNLLSNGSGTVQNGTQLGSNLCDGNKTCP
jgi:hypothetical protein